MIKFKNLFETVYEPRSGDEKNFKDKHVIAKHKTPFESESQFTSKAKKAKRPSDYDTKDDEAVYEAASVHTKRADKEAIIVRDVDTKTGQSRARVIQRRAGEIKIGEEVEQIEEADVKYVIKHKKTKQVLNTHDDYTTAKDEHEGLGDEKSEYGVYKQTKKDAALRNRSTYREEVEQINELSKKTLGSYIKKAADDLDNTSYQSGNHPNRMQRNRLSKIADKRRTGIQKAADRLTKEEAEQIDEISKSTLGSYATKALHRGDIAARMSHSDSDEMGKIANKRLAGVKKAIDKIAPKSAASKIKANIDKARESARNRNSGGGDEGKAYYAAQKGISKVREEVEQIDEAVKVGAMHLHDGSSVTITREMADALNNVLEQLNPMNRVKMEEKMHTSKKDFMEILKFAENI